MDGGLKWRSKATQKVLDRTGRGNRFCDHKRDTSFAGIHSIKGERQLNRMLQPLKDRAMDESLPEIPDAAKVIAN